MKHPQPPFSMNEPCSEWFGCECSVKGRSGCWSSRSLFDWLAETKLSVKLTKRATVAHLGQVV